MMGNYGGTYGLVWILDGLLLVPDGLLLIPDGFWWLAVVVFSGCLVQVGESHIKNIVVRMKV